MAVLKFVIDDDNISDSEYRQALNVVKEYNKAKKKEFQHQQLVLEKAKALNEYQRKKYKNFDLTIHFSSQFLALLQNYFLEFKGYELDSINVSSEELKDINIFKFNRLTNFKSYHLITLVKFLNENEIACTHKLDRNNKLIANFLK